MPTRLAKPAHPHRPAALIAAWQAVPSSVISDLLGGRGHADPSHPPGSEVSGRNPATSAAA